MSRRLEIALVVGVVVLLVLAVWRVPSILIVALGGVGVALVLAFRVRWLTRLMPRRLAILTVFLLMIGGIALALAILVPLLVDQLTSLLSAWPGIQDDLEGMLEGAVTPLQERGLLPTTDTTLSDRPREGFGASGEQAVNDLLNSFLDVATGAVNFAIQLFGVLFVAVYLLGSVLAVPALVVGSVLVTFFRARLRVQPAKMIEGERIVHPRLEGRPFRLLLP